MALGETLRNYKLDNNTVECDGDRDLINLLLNPDIPGHVQDQKGSNGIPTAIFPTPEIAKAAYEKLTAAKSARVAPSQKTN